MSLIKSNHGGLGGSGAPGGALGSFYSHTIDQSLRFNDDDSAYLSRTPSSASNRRTFTFSAWIKVNPAATNYPPIFSADNSTPDFVIRLSNTGSLQVVVENGGGGNSLLLTNRLFRDSSSWYHIVVAIDTTNSTADDRIKIYVNGVQETSFSSRTNPSLNFETKVNNTVLHRLGLQRYGSYWDGYMAEVNFLDGLAYDPSYFGETKDGVWIAKQYSGSYGTNGFHLTFADSSAIGDDTSGNGNDFTANNLAAIDVVPDSPTNNFATLMPMTNIGLSEGNLKMTTTRTGNWDGTIGSFGVTSGKWYYEVRMSATEGTFRCVAGWQGNQASQTVTYNGKGASGSPYNTLFDNYQVSSHTTYFYKDGGTDGTTTAPSSGDVINIAVDFDAGKIWFGVNGTYYANDGGTDGNPGAGTNESLSGIDLTAQEYVPAFHIRSDSSAGGNVMIVNFGQEGTFVGTETAGGNSDANGVGNFFNAVPSGFLALASSNLPDPTIGPGQTEQADDNFNTVLYTGNGNPNSNSQSITGVGFQPDWVWIKSRGVGRHHMLYDSVRGTTKAIRTSLSNAEVTGATTLTSFDSDGFSLGADSDVNTAESFVSWNWKAGGSASSNSNGSITSSVSANTDAGFSIGTFTGTGSAGTLGHGLSSAPEGIILKSRGSTANWLVFHKDITNSPTHIMFLDATNASTDQSRFNDTNPTSSVFSVGPNNAENQSGIGYVFYCFHGVEGYSKFGGYTGNGSSDGTFVFTGFRPAWVMVKRDSATENWRMQDSKRLGYNPEGKELYADLGLVEASNYFDILSNGFKIRNTSNGYNASGSTYIYLAFATAPFKFANAR